MTAIAIVSIMLVAILVAVVHAKASNVIDGDDSQISNNYKAFNPYVVAAEELREGRDKYSGFIYA